MRHTFAIAQMMVVEQVTDNVKEMEAMMRGAQERFRAELILFLETCMAELSREITRELRVEAAGALDGPFVSAVQELTARFSVWTVFGFYECTETADSENRNYNNALILDDRGEIHGHCQRTHLCDAFGYQESDGYLRGEQLFRPTNSPFGKLEPFVHYELRFPEVARVARAGDARILLMPSAWVKDDSKSEHFRTLLKTRTVKNVCYLLAINQYNRIRMGESATIGPMGVATVNADEEETMFPIYSDSERLREMCGKLPSFEGGRGGLYGSLSSNAMNRCQSEI